MTISSLILNISRQFFFLMIVHGYGNIFISGIYIYIYIYTMGVSRETNEKH